MRWSAREIVARVGGLSLSELHLWVREGWVAPATPPQGETPDPASALFDETDLARVRLLRELQQDLAIGREAIPIILSLMDQLYGLRRELRTLSEAVAGQPPAVREAILRACARARAQDPDTAQ
ncbi:MAG: hypothetical protein HXY25_13060 [Alphaproteobacteria bacterium]|nr:hypothetical protein [Alphaproteobacteria bacterium]